MLKAKAIECVACSQYRKSCCILKSGRTLEEVKRNNFDFKKHVASVQQFLLKQNVAFMQIEDDIALYLFEVYCSMQLKTLMVNSFKTH